MSRCGFSVNRLPVLVGCGWGESPAPLGMSRCGFSVNRLPVIGRVSTPKSRDSLQLAHRHADAAVSRETNDDGRTESGAGMSVNGTAGSTTRCCFHEVRAIRGRFGPGNSVVESALLQR